MRQLLFGLLILFAAGTSSAAAYPPKDGKDRSAKKRGDSLVQVPPVLNLLVQEPLQNELGLSDSQRGRIEKIADELEKLASQPADVDPATLPPRERLALRTKLREAEGQLLAQLDRALSTTQWKRLTQIDLQIRGVDILKDVSVMRQLGVSKSQVEQLQRIRGQARDDLIKLKRELSGKDKGRDSKRFYKESSRKLDASMGERMFTVLTGSQRRKLQSIVGRPFDVSRLNLNSKRRNRNKRSRRPKKPDV